MLAAVKPGTCMAVNLAEQLPGDIKGRLFVERARKFHGRNSGEAKVIRGANSGDWQLRTILCFANPTAAGRP